MSVILQELKRTILDRVPRGAVLKTITKIKQLLELEIIQNHFSRAPE